MFLSHNQCSDPQGSSALDCSHRAHLSCGCHTQPGPKRLLQAIYQTYTPVARKKNKNTTQLYFLMSPHPQFLTGLTLLAFLSALQLQRKKNLGKRLSGGGSAPRAVVRPGGERSHELIFVCGHSDFLLLYFPGCWFYTFTVIFKKRFFFFFNSGWWWMPLSQHLGGF